MIVRLAVAALLAGHAVIHFGFVSPRPAPAPGAPPWPFDLGGSWLLGAIGVDGGPGRVIGWALVAAVLGGYAAGGLAAIGVVPAGLFGPAVVVGSVASLALLVVFFQPWLVLGVALDVALLWAVLVARWDGPAG